MKCCDILEKFGAPNNVLKEYKYWKIQLRPKQNTLGCCVIILNRHIEKFSDINQEEISELASVVKELENALKKAFKYDKINYLVLMMVDKHFHFHVIPRYEKERNFANVLWKDKDWPKPTSSSEVSEPDPFVLEKIKLEIYHNLV